MLYGTILFLAIFYIAIRIAGYYILKYNPPADPEERGNGPCTIKIDPKHPALTFNIRGADVQVKRSLTDTEISVEFSDNYGQWQVNGGSVTQVNYNGLDYNFGCVSLQLTGVFAVALIRDLYNICALIQGNPIVQSVFVPTSTVVVTVPHSYKGDFVGNFSGSSTLNLESWMGGNVKLDYAASGDAVIGPLTLLDSFVLVQSGFGAVSLSDIQGVSVSIQSDGSGELALTGRVEAGSLLLAATSFGGVVVEKDVFASQAFTLQVNGSGDVVFSGGVQAGAFDVRVSSFGDLTLEGVSGKSINVSVTGSGDFSAKSLTAEDGSVKVDTSSFGGATASVIRSHQVQVTATGSADIEADVIEAQGVNALLTSFGGISVHSLSAGRLDVRCSGSGDFTATGSAKAGNVVRSSFGDVNLHGDFNFGAVSE